MKNLENQTPTFESIWAKLQETSMLLTKSQADFKSKMKDLQYDIDCIRKDFDRLLKNLTEQIAKATKCNDDSAKVDVAYSNVLNIIENHSEIAFQNAWAKIQRELPVPEDISEAEAKHNRNINRMNKYRYYIDEDTGTLCFDGFYAEEYFLTAFKYGKKTFFGEKFEGIMNHFNTIGGYTYELIMFNDSAVAVIDFKNDDFETNIPKLLKKGADLRISFSDFQNHRLYFGMVAQTFDPKLEQECINNGIAIIKQIDGTVVINDAHLKVY